MGKNDIEHESCHQNISVRSETDGQTVDAYLSLPKQLGSCMVESRFSIGRLGVWSTATAWIDVALFGQERSPQPPRQEKCFRFRPDAANCHHEIYSKKQVHSYACVELHPVSCLLKPKHRLSSNDQRAKMYTFQKLWLIIIWKAKKANYSRHFEKILGVERKNLPTNSSLEANFIYINFHIATFLQM